MCKRSSYVYICYCSCLLRRRSGLHEIHHSRMRHESVTQIKGICKCEPVAGKVAIIITSAQPMVGDTINTNTLSFDIEATKHELNERCTYECIQKSTRRTSSDQILRERERIEF